MSNIEAFLAALASGYEVRETKIESKVLSVNVESEKLVQVKRKPRPHGVSGLTPPKQNQVQASVVSRPCVETLDAPSFVAAMRAAGMRAGKRDENLVKSDEIKALQSFVGYAFGEPHGTQVDNAKRKALLAIKGTGPNVQKISPQKSGFVAGVPNEERKAQLNILGRLNASLQTCQDLRKLIANDPASPKLEERKMFLALEEARAAQIRLDMGE